MNGIDNREYPRTFPHLAHQNAPGWSLVLSNRNFFFIFLSSSSQCLLPCIGHSNFLRKLVNYEFLLSLITVLFRLEQLSLFLLLSFLFKIGVLSRHESIDRKLLYRPIALYFIETALSSIVHSQFRTGQLFTMRLVFYLIEQTDWRCELDTLINVSESLISLVHLLFCSSFEIKMRKSLQSLLHTLFVSLIFVLSIQLNSCRCFFHWQHHSHGLNGVKWSILPYLSLHLLSCKHSKPFEYSQ